MNRIVNPGYARPTRALPANCECCLVAERWASDPDMRVRFPSLAPKLSFVQLNGRGSGGDTGPWSNGMTGLLHGPRPSPILGGSTIRRYYGIFTDDENKI